MIKLILSIVVIIIFVFLYVLFYLINSEIKVDCDKSNCDGCSFIGCIHNNKEEKK